MTDRTPNDGGTAPAGGRPAAPNEPVLLPDMSDGGVLTLTLNRPAVFNALSEDLVEALKSALETAAKDSAVRVVAIRAAGRAFCTGHDLREMRARPDRAYYTDLFERSSAMMQVVTAMPQPVIAQVQGIATAAGCQLVAACDLAIAAESAVFATNGIDNGLFCSTPSVPLSRTVARKHAFEMLFTGAFISAARAAEIGLINRAVPDDELDGAVAALAGRIAAKSTVTTRSGKRMFYRQLGLEPADAYDFAARNMARDMMSEDAAEGLDAFLQKRKPVWKDR